MLSFSSWVWRPSRLHQVRAVACLPPSPPHSPPDAAPSQPRAGPAASHGTCPLAARAVLRCAVAPLAGSLARSEGRCVLSVPSQHPAGTFCALRSSRFSCCCHCQIIVFSSVFFLVRHLSGYPEPPTPASAWWLPHKPVLSLLRVQLSAGTPLPFLSGLFSLPLTCGSSVP